MTEAQWQAKAAGEVGGTVTNSVFVVTLPLATTGGTFTLTLGGVVSAPIAFDASAVQLQSALDGMTTVGPGNAKSNGLKKGPYSVELCGELSGQAIPAGYLTASGASLVPSAILTPAIENQGATDSLVAQAAALWGSYPTLTDALRYLYVKRDLALAELGKFVGQVDNRDGDAESKDSQRFANLNKVLSEAKTAITSAELLAASGSRNQTYTGSILKTTPNGLPFGRIR